MCISKILVLAMLLCDFTLTDFRFLLIRQEETSSPLIQADANICRFITSTFGRPCEWRWDANSDTSVSSSASNNQTFTSKFDSAKAFFPFLSLAKRNGAHKRDNTQLRIALDNAAAALMEDDSVAEGGLVYNVYGR